MQAVASTMRRFGANVEALSDVASAKNTAIVMIEAVIPDHGAREGDLLDIRVTAFAAKSLEGGQLIPTPLIYHDRTVDGLFAYAQGRIALDGPQETTGVIRAGARMERDVFINVISTGSMLRSVARITALIAGCPVAARNSAVVPVYDVP